MRDEGRPFGIGFQEQVSNHSKLLRVKSRGGEHWGQSVREHPEQVWIRKTNKIEPSLTRRKPENCCQNQGRFYFLGSVCRTLGYWTDGNRRIGGVSLIWAFMWNCGNQLSRC
jgi:hypothetical protein